MVLLHQHVDMGSWSKDLILVKRPKIDQNNEFWTKDDYIREYRIKSGFLHFDFNPIFDMKISVYTQNLEN